VFPEPRYRSRVSQPPPGADAGHARPRALVAVVVAVSVEALLLLGVAAFFGLEMLVARATDLGTAAAIAVLALLMGLFLAFCARGLWHGRRWARAPIMTWQLLTVLGVVPSLGGERWWIAAALLVLCLVAAVGLLLPAVVARTTERADPPVA
jgi:hypothetical protein